MSHTLRSGDLQLLLPDARSAFTAGTSISIPNDVISSQHTDAVNGQVFPDITETSWAGVSYQAIDVAGGLRMQVTAPSAPSMTYVIIMAGDQKCC